VSPDEIRASFAGLRPPPADPAPARAAVADALLAARRHPELAADWRIAEASLQHPDALALWAEALDHLPRPARDRDRCYVHSQLARLRLSGGDAVRGRAHLTAALALARGNDARLQARLAFRLGAALLEAGLPTEAAPLLSEALTAGTDDSLIELGCATVLAGLHLDGGDLDRAIDLGARVAMLGALRGNWIAVADGLITQSACHRLREDWPAALRVVLHGSQRLQALHALAALNLLKAHLVALREAMGEEPFDELFEALVAELREQPPG